MGCWVLALDTALGACSCALVHDGEIRANRFQRRERGHAEAVMVLLEQAAAEAGCSLRELGRIIVTVGPGTFTGIRVGIAAARGLALVKEAEVVGITSLQAIALNVRSPSHPVVVVNDARRDQVYVQAFSPTGVPLAPASLRQAKDLVDDLPAGDFVLIGTGADLLADQDWADRRPPVVADASPLPDAAIFGTALAGCRKIPGALAAEPLYLRAPDAAPMDSWRGELNAGK